MFCLDRQSCNWLPYTKRHRECVNSTFTLHYLSETLLGPSSARFRCIHGQYQSSYSKRRSSVSHQKVTRVTSDVRTPHWRIRRTSCLMRRLPKASRCALVTLDSLRQALRVYEWWFQWSIKTNCICNCGVIDAYANRFIQVCIGLYFSIHSIASFVPIFECSLKLPIIDSRSNNCKAELPLRLLIHQAQNINALVSTARSQAN